MRQPELFWAADVETSDKAVQMMQRIGQTIDGIKVGLELFIAASIKGEPIVQQMKGFHLPVFLDLKLHDIPETVKRAARAAAESGADYLSVHAAGGPKMLEAAVEGAKGTGLKIWAITVLTSMDREQLTKTGWFGTDVEYMVRARAMLARETGCAGIVASPKEALAIRELMPDPSFTIATPGIRPRESEGKDDQKRVGTAFAACRDGSNFCIVGRPIRDAADPAAAAVTLKSEMLEGWKYSASH
jgi:orotidine-5'-phosphate decarboxylase